MNFCQSTTATPDAYSSLVSPYYQCKQGRGAVLIPNQSIHPQVQSCRRQPGTTTTVANYWRITGPDPSTSLSQHLMKTDRGQEKNARYTQSTVLFLKGNVFSVSHEASVALQTEPKPQARQRFNIQTQAHYLNPPLAISVTFGFQNPKGKLQESLWRADKLSSSASVTAEGSPRS